MERRKSKKIKLGNTFIGGDSPILVQSMLNIPASNIDGSVEQAKELAAAGCQVIRFAIPNEDALNLIEPIKKAVDVPLVADIHFDYKLALGAAERGIDKIRINPGNIGDDSRVKAVADICKQKNIPIRIGVIRRDRGHGCRGRRAHDARPVRHRDCQHLRRLRQQLPGEPGADAVPGGEPGLHRRQRVHRRPGGARSRGRRLLQPPRLR